MSSPHKEIPGLEDAPYIGALLRLAHRQTRVQLIEALVKSGFNDIDEAYFSLFQYPPIDGQRPAAVARQLGISKQALNHLLGQLERLGYLQRCRQGEKGPTTIRLTDKGWQVVASNIAAIRQLEADWQQKLGKPRFAELKGILKELTSLS